MIYGCSDDDDNKEPTLSVREEIRNQRVTLKMNASDQDGEIASISINWGDGAGNDIFENFENVSEMHEYASLGEYEIVVIAKDNDGSQISVIKTIDIISMNELPQIEITETITNQRIMLAGNVIDSDNVLEQVIIDWGDGTEIVEIIQDFSDISLSHLYSTTGTYFITIFAKDNTKESIEKVIEVNVTANQAPVIDVSYEISGEKITFTGKVTDEDSEIEYLRINTGDNTEYKFIEANFDTIIWEYEYDNSGTYKITLDAKDVLGGISNVNFENIVILVNHKPEIDLNLTAKYNTAEITGKVTDSDGTVAKLVIDWGDEITEEISGIDFENISIAHTYEAEGTYTIVINAYDNENGITNCTKQISSVFEIPKVELQKITDEYTVNLEGSISMETAGISAVYFDWDDGTKSTVSGNFENIILSHSYIALGLYNIEITIKDVNGKTYVEEIECEIIGDGIYFEDKNLENYIRELTGVSSGYVTKDNVKTITQLNISSKNIKSVIGLEKFINLEFFIAENNSISDVSMLKTLTKLKNFDIENNNVTDVSVLANFPELKTVILKANGITDISVLENCTKIETLDIGFTMVTPDDFAVLKKLTSIKSLNLGYLGLDNEELSVIGELTTLTWLEAGNNEISSIENISGLINLEWLSLKENLITDISIIETFTKLISLNIAGNQIADITDVLNLELTDFYVTDNDVLSNESNDAIQTLIANGCNVEYDYQKEMTLVESGTFQMGNVLGDSNSGEDELPVHTVIITTDFYMGKYEVVNKDYARFLQEEELTTGEYNGNELIDLDDDDNPIQYNSTTEKFSVDTGKEYYPIAEITWWGAIYYCNWLSKKEGLKPAYDEDSGDLLDSNGNITAYVDKVEGYRLPTEAEWEFAARGGNLSQGYIYSGSNNAGEVAWYAANSGGSTHEVGMKKANELGIYDMSGNVWEWCTDWIWGEYPESEVTNPYNYTKPSNMSADTLTAYRMRRGGGYRLYGEEHNATGESQDTTGASDIRVSNRIEVIQKSKDSQGKSRPDLGFRIVKNKK